MEHIFYFSVLYHPPYLSHVQSELFLIDSIVIETMAGIKKRVMDICCSGFVLFFTNYSHISLITFFYSLITIHLLQ